MTVLSAGQYSEEARGQGKVWSQGFLREGALFWPTKTVCAQDFCYSLVVVVVVLGRLFFCFRWGLSVVLLWLVVWVVSEEARGAGAAGRSGAAARAAARTEGWARPSPWCAGARAAAAAPLAGSVAAVAGAVIT